MGAESTSACTWVKHLADLLRNKANSQQYPSIYEDRRPKSIEDTEKPDGKGIASGQNVPGTNTGTRVTAAPGPSPLGLPQDSWERVRLTAPSPDKQGLSSTKRDWLLEVTWRGIRTK